MLFFGRLIETLTCEVQMLLWRLDPWLAVLGGGSMEAPTTSAARSPLSGDTAAESASEGLRDEAKGCGPSCADEAALSSPDRASGSTDPMRTTSAANDECSSSSDRDAPPGLPGAATNQRARAPAPAKLAAALSAALLLPVLPYINHLAWSSRYPPSYWQRAAAEMLRPPVYDSNGMLAGYVPGEAGADAGDVYAVQPDAVPEACVDLVLLREDRHAGAGLRHALGVDWLRLAGAVVTRRGGGSTLPMQLARQLAGWQTSMGALNRKWREIGVAQALLDAHGGSYRSLARTYLATAPFAQYQGDVRGITEIAESMWGIRPSKLTAAQCALLVTMLPVRMNLKADDAKAEERWASRQRQAEALLREAYGERAEPMVAQVHASGRLGPRRELIEALGATATYNIDARSRKLVLPHLDRMAADGRWNAVELAVGTPAGAMP